MAVMQFLLCVCACVPYGLNGIPPSLLCAFFFFFYCAVFFFFWQASAEKSEGEEVGFEALWGPTCKQALLVGLGLVTLQQVRENIKSLKNKK